MRSTSIFPGGPPRRDDDLLTDFAEVRAARRLLQQGRANAKPEFHQRPFRIETSDGRPVEFLDEAIIRVGPEQFDSHLEYEAARDLEHWGDDPFGED